MDYPKHLIEKIRIEVALSYFQHELRKIFPSISLKELKNLFNNKELAIPRDFWNGLHGVSMGFKLKNILYLVTAENIAWENRVMNVADLSFGVELPPTRIVKPGKISVLEFIEYYRKNPAEKLEQLKHTIKIRGNDEIRETDPIIAINRKEDGKKVIRVHDGNGRLSRHLLEDKNKIEVFLGSQSGEKLLNYWIPTQLLLDCLYFVYQAIDDKNDELFDQQIAVLKNMLSFSKSGQYEFSERALTTKTEYREKILTAMGI